MASVGYGEYTYGKSHYGQPVYHFGVATSAQTSSMTASAKQIDRGVATIAQTSSMTAVGVQIDRGSATSAQTSGMTSTGHRIHLGTGTSAQTSSMTATGKQIDRGVFLVRLFYAATGITVSCLARFSRCMDPPLVDQ